MIGQRQISAVVGLNCAACHVKSVVQIEGAPGTIESAFQKRCGPALGFNLKFPFSAGRYSRFAARVLGPMHGRARPATKREPQCLVGPLMAEDRHEAMHLYANKAGFQRTDALTRIASPSLART
jgi:hypothetical protein